MLTSASCPVKDIKGSFTSRLARLSAHLAHLGEERKGRGTSEKRGLQPRVRGLLAAGVGGASRGHQAMPLK